MEFAIYTIGVNVSAMWLLETGLRYVCALEHTIHQYSYINIPQPGQPRVHKPCRCRFCSFIRTVYILIGCRKVLCKSNRSLNSKRIVLEHICAAVMCNSFPDRLSYFWIWNINAFFSLTIQVNATVKEYCLVSSRFRRRRLQAQREPAAS